MSRKPNAVRSSNRARHGLRATAATLIAILASGCVSVPPPLQGEWSAVTPREATESHRGELVRWGGRIVAVESEGERTCFRMIAQPLAPNGQPDGSDASLGRFSACRVGNYDARTFAPNREVTLTGRIEGFDEGAAGGAESPAPRVAAMAVVLWPRRR